MLKKWLILCFMTVFTLVACNSPVYNQTEGNIADAKLQAEAMHKKSDNDAKTPPSLKIDKGLYVDTTPINLNKSPTWLKNHIVIRGDQLPFSYYTRVIAEGANSHVLIKYQGGLDSSAKMSLSFSGTVKEALDLLAARTGYEYVIEGKTIFWKAFVTKTFEVAFMPGGTDYFLGNTSGGTVGAGGGGGGSGATTSNYVNSDGSSSEFSNLKGTLSLWKDLNETLSKLKSPEGQIVVSEATTSVTAHDHPLNVALIEQYINNLNHNLSKQVLVKIQLIEVNLENDYNFGIDWRLIARAFHNSPFIINGNYGTPVAIQALTTQGKIGALNQDSVNKMPQMGTIAMNNQIPSWTILLNALSQQGKASVVSEPRVLCLNNQVSVVRIAHEEGYLASIQNTSTGGSGETTAAQNTVTSQLTPGTVTTGLTLYILPKILNGNVYMQVNADISTNNGFQTFGTNNNEIQLPNITMKHFNQRSLIRSGDTLILSGFKQATNIANANQFLKSQALGGKGSSMESTETIVLITPIVLDGSA